MATNAFLLFTLWDFSVSFVVSIHLILTTTLLGIYFCYLHFTDGESEAQKCKDPPKSHN
jgi:hypothetical protein